MIIFKKHSLLILKPSLLIALTFAVLFHSEARDLSSLITPKNSNSSEKTEPTNSQNKTFNKHPYLHQTFFGLNMGYSHTIEKDNNTNISSRHPKNHTISSSPIVSLSIGKHYNDFLKYSLELNYKFPYKSVTHVNTTQESQKFKNTALFFNPVFYLPISHFNNQMQLLFLTGFGVSYNKSSDITTVRGVYITPKKPGKNTLNFAWQVGSGVSTKMNKFTNIELLVKYIDRGTALSKDSNRKQKLNSVDFSVGLSFDIDKK